MFTFVVTDDAVRIIDSSGDTFAEIPAFASELAR